MKYEEVIYLDADWISNTYELFTGKRPVTQLKKMREPVAEFENPTIRSDGYVSELRTYDLSTMAMYQDIIGSIDTYKDCSKVSESAVGQVVWVKGGLSIGEVNLNLHSSRPDVVQALQIWDESIRVVFNVKEQYFSSGYENVFNLPLVVQQSVTAKVSVLCKLIGWNRTLEYNVAIPYLIRELPIDSA